MTELQPIIVHGRHFIRHLGTWNQICVKRLLLMWLSLQAFRWKNEVAILINGWLTADYSVSRPPFCPPSWNLKSVLCQTVYNHSHLDTADLTISDCWKRWRHKTRRTAFTLGASMRLSQRHAYSHGYSPVRPAAILLNLLAPDSVYKLHRASRQLQITSTKISNVSLSNVRILFKNTSYRNPTYM